MEAVAYTRWVGERSTEGRNRATVDPQRPRAGSAHSGGCTGLQVGQRNSLLAAGQWWGSPVGETRCVDTAGQVQAGGPAAPVPEPCSRSSARRQGLLPQS